MEEGRMEEGGILVLVVGGWRRWGEGVDDASCGGERGCRVAFWSCVTTLLFHATH
jgi:hypothetical protein